MNKDLYTDLVTIITVTYNAEKYIEQTIKSVIYQDYSNIEYIIIDGASSDGTVDIIKKYEKFITYWISEPDKGVYDAMNKGIDVATGKWINFMNAGDTFVSNFTVSTIMKKLQPTSELVYGDSFLISKTEKQYRKAKNIDNFFNGIPFCHQALFAKRAILNKYKFNTFYSIAADYDFILKAFTVKHHYQYVDIPVCNFLDDGLSQQQILKSSIEAMMVISKYSRNLELIYDSNPFRIICKNNTKLNYYFSVLFNKFILEIIRLGLNQKLFVLYGFGHLGKIIYNEFQDNIQMIVDKQSNKVDKKIKKDVVYNPKNLNHLQYDNIVISVLGREEEVIKYLVEEIGVDKKKIITFEI